METIQKLPTLRYKAKQRSMFVFAFGIRLRLSESLRNVWRLFVTSNPPQWFLNASSSRGPQRAMLEWGEEEMRSA